MVFPGAFGKSTALNVTPEQLKFTVTVLAAAPDAQTTSAARPSAAAESRTAARIDIERIGFESPAGRVERWGVMSASELLRGRGILIRASSWGEEPAPVAGL